MARNSDWSAWPNGMVDELADADAFLVQDASDTTESPAGTTKGVLADKVVRSLGSISAIRGPLSFAEYDSIPKNANTMYVIIE